MPKHVHFWLLLFFLSISISLSGFEDSGSIFLIVRGEKDVWQLLRVDTVYLLVEFNRRTSVITTHTSHPAADRPTETHSLIHLLTNCITACFIDTLIWDHSLYFSMQCCWTVQHLERRTFFFKYCQGFVKYYVWKVLLTLFMEVIKLSLWVCVCVCVC